MQAGERWTGPAENAVEHTSKHSQSWRECLCGLLGSSAEHGEVKRIVDSILEARTDSPLNAIHVYRGLKADLYPVLEVGELRQSVFQRRQQVDYGPHPGKVYIHSPEDLILYKLMYFGLSRHSNHFRDIAAILKAKKNQLDLNHSKQWAAQLGLRSLWKEMLLGKVQK